MGLRSDIKRAFHDVTVNIVAAGGLGIPSIRVRFLRLCGLNIGAGTKIHGRCWFGGRNIYIGERSWINYGATFDNAARIEIGNDCLIGPQVMFVTSTHHLGPSSRRGGDAVSERIKIGDGCWLGARTVILPGVTIGDGCVIAAGAIVRNDCIPNTLYAGVPAQAIRELP